MDKLTIIQKLLDCLGMPSRQRGQICSLTLLSMASLKKGMAWEQATNHWIRIHDIIGFIAENYNIEYAENSRETFRKQALHPFRTAALIEDNGVATNSPNYRYRLTEEFLDVIKNLSANDVGDIEPSPVLKDFLRNHESLASIYKSKRLRQKMPVRINHKDFTFSPGRHNQLQKAIIEEFVPRFAPGTECLYIGDTIKKDMVKDIDRLSELGFEITLHDKMPDVVLYDAERDWIYFIEAVTSVGPMDAKRIVEIESMTRDVKSGKIFITAFLDFTTYRRFSSQLAWETEVWIADIPDHMIHLNGDKFMGPYLR